MKKKLKCSSIPLFQLTKIRRWINWKVKSHRQKLEWQGFLRPSFIGCSEKMIFRFVNRLIKLVNQKNKQKCSLIFDEFPTIFINGIDSLIATARSNKVATCLGLQDFSQLRKDYGADQSSVIMNIAGNIISGQVTGDPSKALAERFGKIIQVKESISINRNDTSVSKSGQLDFAIPASKIAALSSGEFVGMVADDPYQKIKLKSFHCEIINDKNALQAEEKHFLELPVISNITPEMVLKNYYRIKQEIEELIETEIEALLNTPGKENILLD